MTDIRETDPGFNPNQHCTYEKAPGGEGDYTFSHTAAYCGMPQPRRCACPFDYPEPDHIEHPPVSVIVEDLLAYAGDSDGSAYVPAELLRHAAAALTVSGELE